MMDRMDHNINAAAAVYLKIQLARKHRIVSESMSSIHEQMILSKLMA